MLTRTRRALSAVGATIAAHLNFYRIHLLVFTFVPLVLSGIFYAANGEFKIAYIDSLYMCFSAFTVTGLASINLSTCTPFQQFLLWIQMLCGGLVTVSWVIVFVRKQFFKSKFHYLVRSHKLARERVRRDEKNGDTIVEDVPVDSNSATTAVGDEPLAVHRFVGQPRRIGPDGQLVMMDGSPRRPTHVLNDVPETPHGVLLNSPMAESFPSPATSHSRARLPRQQTINFAEPPVPRDSDGRSLRLHRTQTAMSDRPSRAPEVGQRDRGFGGFPLPFEIVNGVLRRLTPGVHSRLTRTLSIQPEHTMASVKHSTTYLTFEAIIGRNSNFYGLTHEEEEELGGVEYRALGVLLWTVGLYWLFMQLICWMVLALSAGLHGGYDFVFDNQFRYVNPVWFALFFTTSCFANCGLSLADQGMVQFQTAYGMSIALIIVILGGNTGFPVFLRFLLWTMTKLLPEHSRSRETMLFLLDHPRRCFTYLFPARTTWLLALVLFILNVWDWLSFEICDIGNPAIDAIPVGTRIMDGLLQSIAVRTAGFNVVNIATLEPSVKVMITIMMYISAYPIAMSVRSTNVYEEKSLGVFNDEGEDEEPNGPWGSYLAWHVKKQLAFDMWWLFLALWIICIIERHNINETYNDPWFDIFPIFFELVSAYGTVGLSLGIPNQNYALSGDFSPLSKLVVIIVMLRGRHRGLPVAIDRSLVLPYEFKNHDDHPVEAGAETSDA
ncbi:TrkH-domain-containing protein [Calocera viscosa TUFC12733]|uniref:Potassium transport protein n=1 Tax=Calocera viscosa (strain TUFC12733) TaxID=1330018 RepID=A0A167S2P3_CALVF|nr:TrkH-domain-containing protein [Calocera viscosa TUFC12733]